MKRIFDPLKIEHRNFPQNLQADAVAQRRIVDQSHPGVYAYYDRYQARVSIGKVQHTLAIGTVHACLRMANAGLYYFWKYRSKIKRDVVDTDLPIGIAVAKADLDQCPWLCEYFVGIEQTLTAEGLLGSPVGRVADAPARFDREKLLLVWSNCEKVLRGAIRELAMHGEPAKFLHADMTERVDSLAKCIETADRAILKPASLAPRDASTDQAL